MPADQDRSPVLSEETVRKVAALARLAITDEQVGQYRAQLSEVLAYVERIRTVDLEGVEPLLYPGETPNRMRDDEPGGTLSPDDVAGLAPESFDRFIKVPKVLGDGGGA